MSNCLGVTVADSCLLAMEALLLVFGGQRVSTLGRDSSGAACGHGDVARFGRPAAHHAGRGHIHGGKVGGQPHRGAVLGLGRERLAAVPLAAVSQHPHNELGN